MIAGMAMRLHQLMTDGSPTRSIPANSASSATWSVKSRPANTVRTSRSPCPPTKGIIASTFNPTQEHFSRILHELTELGLIVVEGRKTTSRISTGCAHER